MSSKKAIFRQGPFVVSGDHASGKTLQDRVRALAARQHAPTRAVAGGGRASLFVKRALRRRARCCAAVRCASLPPCCDETDGGGATREGGGGGNREAAGSGGHSSLCGSDRRHQRKRQCAVRRLVGDYAASVRARVDSLALVPSS